MGEKAIVKRVDHIVFRTENPYELFSIFADILRLPVVWSVSKYKFFTSGGVYAGNAYLEAVNFGNAISKDNAEAQLWGVAFEPYSLPESLDELRRRNVPHSPPFSYTGTRIDGKSGVAWTNVTLGGLLSNSWKTFYLGKRFGGNSYINLLLGRIAGKLFMSRLGGLLVSKFLDDSMVYLCEYTHDNEALRDAKHKELIAGQGGALGVEGVKEVVIGVTEFEEKQSRWQGLLAPTLPFAPASWQPDGGVAVRLVLHSENVIKLLVLKVASLTKARNFLAERGMLGINLGHGITISPARIQGLNIYLVE